MNTLFNFKSSLSARTFSTVCPKLDIILITGLYEELATVWFKYQLYIVHEAVFFRTFVIEFWSDVAGLSECYCHSNHESHLPHLASLYFASFYTLGKKEALTPQIMQRSVSPAEELRKKRDLLADAAEKRR